MQEPYPTLLEQLYSPYSYPPPPLCVLKQGEGRGIRESRELSLCEESCPGSPISDPYRLLLQRRADESDKPCRLLPPRTSSELARVAKQPSLAFLKQERA